MPRQIVFAFLVENVPHGDAHFAQRDSALITAYGEKGRRIWQLTEAIKPEKCHGVTVAAVFQTEPLLLADLLDYIWSSNQAEKGVGKNVIFVPPRLQYSVRNAIGKRHWDKAAYTIIEYDGVSEIPISITI